MPLGHQGTRSLAPHQELAIAVRSDIGLAESTCTPGYLVTPYAQHVTIRPSGPAGAIARTGLPVITQRSAAVRRRVSPDPTAKPLIVHNYYAEPEDLRAQVAGIRICLEIARTEPLAGWVSEPYIASASDEDEDIISAIRARARRLW